MVQKQLDLGGLAGSQPFGEAVDSHDGRIFFDVRFTSSRRLRLVGHALHDAHEFPISYGYIGPYSGSDTVQKRLVKHKSCLHSLQVGQAKDHLLLMHLRSLLDLRSFHAR